MTLAVPDSDSAANEAEVTIVIMQTTQRVIVRIQRDDMTVSRCHMSSLIVGAAAGFVKK